LGHNVSKLDASKGVRYWTDTVWEHPSNCRGTPKTPNNATRAFQVKAVTYEEEQDDNINRYNDSYFHPKQLKDYYNV